MKAGDTEKFFASSAGRFVRWLISIAGGIAVGVFLHFILFRMGLPVEPFIYVAF